MPLKECAKIPSAVTRYDFPRFGSQIYPEMIGTFPNIIGLRIYNDIPGTFFKI